MPKHYVFFGIKWQNATLQTFAVKKEHQLCGKTNTVQIPQCFAILKPPKRFLVFGLFRFLKPGHIKKHRFFARFFAGQPPLRGLRPKSRSKLSKMILSEMGFHPVIFAETKKKTQLIFFRKNERGQLRPALEQAHPFEHTRCKAEQFSTGDSP